MSLLVAAEQVEKVFSLDNGGDYIALTGIDLTIKKGEFVSFIGHSGCGKSTLLNMIAGLSLPSSGVLTLEGKRIQGPGPDRMVVFQNYSLLPWRTVRENIALAVERVYRDLPRSEQREIIQEHIDLVGLTQAADKMPDQLSGGMKQRVAIARALAIRPKLLLLDEPFGALDALTRGNLQTQLMRICDENNVTAIMVTHDVDEAVLLSDRIVMLTNGPGAKIGNILPVEIPRPRRRMEVVNHPSYYSLRSEIIYFLNQQKQIKKLRARKTVAVSHNGLEKVNLELGFVPLTACAPLAIAQEKGFFKKHGLDEVHLVRESSWRGIADGIAGGYLDAAQMPSGMPLWFSLGGYKDRPLAVVTALTMTRNGNAVTLARRFYEQGIHTLSDFRAMIQNTPEVQHRMGVVHPASMHNLLLRYWLAAGGIDPDRDLSLQPIPPAQMVADLKNNTIDGFCVGEPWNLRASMDNIGFTIATDREIYDGHPGKVLGVREDWATAYPNTHIALIKALLEASQYCANPENIQEIRSLLSQRKYLGTAIDYIQLGNPNGVICSLEQPMREYAHHLFFGNGANRPSRTEHLWHMTQMARWGHVTFARNWLEILERIVRVDVYSTAARELDLLDVKFTRGSIQLFDGTEFNGEDPIHYLNELAIKRSITIADVVLDPIDRTRIFAA